MLPVACLDLGKMAPAAAPSRVLCLGKRQKCPWKTARVSQDDDPNPAASAPVIVPQSHATGHLVLPDGWRAAGRDDSPLQGSRNLAMGPNFLP
jgi:hypothetical protein